MTPEAIIIPLAPFRIPNDEDKVSATDWSAGIEAWHLALRYYLALPSEKFRKELDRSENVAVFLLSYVQELRIRGNESPTYPIKQALHRDCFSLIHRSWFEVDTPPSLLSPSFLKYFSVVYGGNESGLASMDRLWAEKALGDSPAILKDKGAMQQLLEATSPKNERQLHSPLLETRACIKACHQYGIFLMAGADFLDALILSWKSATPETQSNITLVTYTALVSLTQGSEPRLSTLLDHLYTLRMDQEQVSSKSSLLADLIKSTPFLRKYRRMTKLASSGRVSDMLPHLEKLGRPPPSKERNFRGKQTALPPDHAQLQESAAISQIHELFPELGLGYIARLVDEYNQQGEEVIAHLLDHSLPTYLQNVDRQETMKSYQSHQIRPIKPKAAEGPEQTNAFDCDDLGRLEVPAESLYIGKKPEEDVMSKPFDKNVTLAALAALDSDDDERDDTYDAEDVGGTIDVESPEHDQRDSALGTDGGIVSEATEAALFQAWSQNVELFSRKPMVRNSPLRAELKEKSGWSDEQIEGWAIMLQREPKRVKRLQEKFSDDYYLRQARKHDGDTSDGSDDALGNDQHADGGASRGRGQSHRGGRGRGRRGGGVPTGPTSERSTQVARQRKDAHKSSRGNHNRRALRAKKMARGM